MAVLAYNNPIRRFMRQHGMTWHNMRFQWGVISFAAFCLLWITSPESGNTLDQAWYVIAARMFFALIMFQFGYAAWKLPLLDKEMPETVRWYEKLKCWWEHIATPGYYGTLRGGHGIKIIRPVSCDFSEVYDAYNGDLIGHEQDVWNDGNWTYTPVGEDDERRMPMIALWRTRWLKDPSINPRPSDS